MLPLSKNARFAALAAVCALSASCSSPVEVDSEAARGAKILVSPLQVDFGSSGTTASVTLENTTKRAMGWTASESAGWLSLGETSGTLWAGDSRTISLSASRISLSAGSHQTSLKISASNGGGTEELPVSIIVSSTTSEPAQLSVSPLQVDFGTASTAQSVTLTNTGDASLSWTASESAGWLALGATSGTLAGKSSKTLSLSADRSGMTAGTYTASVSISAGSAGSATESVWMTVPSEPAGSEVLLAGQLVDQFGGQGMAGLTVQFKGATAVTDATGSFVIAGSPTTSSSQLTLSGSGVYRRVTNARTGDASWRVVPASFNMAAFDDVARDEFGPATVRWTSPPTVYVDTRPEGFQDGPELQKWISQVQVQAAEFVTKWTGATIDPADVIVTSSPPRDYSTGTIVIHFSENDADYGNNSNMIGYARVSWSSNGSISGSAVWLRYLRYSGDAYAGKRRGILGHELGHAMGLGHMNGSTLSLMQPSIGSKTDLSGFDHQTASLVYTRMPGNTTADVDPSTSTSKSLAPAAAPTFTEWVCEAGVESPDR